MDMLSYRHAFHAGNHADVLKHCALATALRYMGEKDAPYLYAETHAGAGAYGLDEGFAAKNREWENGIDRLSAYARARPAPRAVAAYLETVEDFRARRGPAAYPGSPAIASALLRERDRAVLYELHPADFPALEALLAEDPRAQVRREDGLRGLRSLLPPPSRRALVLVDPSYEVKDEYARVAEALADALRRFATGSYLAWYPLLDREEARAFPGSVLALSRGKACRAELRLTAPEPGSRGMAGSGIVALNPPWALKAALEESLPYLADALGRPGEASWVLEWED